MMLYAYGCPACGEWSRTCAGALVGDILQVLCPTCGNVEHIENHAMDAETLRGAPV